MERSGLDRLVRTRSDPSGSKGSSEPRVILVTGASSGIGREIAKLLVKQGDFPILVARKREPLESFEKEWNPCATYVCDVNEQSQVERLVKEIMERYGKIDVLVNNAGVGHFGGALDLSVEEYERIMNTNYLGAVRFALQVIPHMIKRGRGTIINMASLAGLTGIPNLAAYSASKFALIGFSEALRLEFSPRIRIGVLCPGPVKTPFFGNLVPERQFPPLIARHMMDAESVAKEAVRLIDKPTFKIVPWTLKWALALRRFLPNVYLWTTGKVYRSWMEKSKISRPI